MAFAFISLQIFLFPRILTVSPKPVSPKLQLLGPQIKLFILCSLETKLLFKSRHLGKEREDKARHTGTCEGEWWGLTGTCISCLFLGRLQLRCLGCPYRKSWHASGWRSPSQEARWPRRQALARVCYYCNTHSTATCPTHKHGVFISTFPSAAKHLSWPPLT